jgi:hypothetical protein
MQRSKEDSVIYCKEELCQSEWGEVINNYHMEQLPEAGIPIRAYCAKT